MFGLFSSPAAPASKKHTVLVTECDSWIGFYCAWGMLKNMNKDPAVNPLVASFPHIAATATTSGSAQQRQQDDKYYSGIEKVVCAVRDRETDFARELEKLGAEIREWKGDEYTDINKLKDTLFKNDITALALVPVHDLDKMHHVSEAFVEAAERTEGRVTCLTLWSSLGALHYPHHGGDSAMAMSKDTYKHIFRHFVLIEKRVRDSKIKHEVIMRVGFVQQMLFGFANVIQNRGLLPWSHRGNKVAAVNAKDLGHATANLLAHEPAMAKYNKQTLILTGPKAYSGEDMVKVANKTLQARIQLEQVPLDDLAKILRQNADADETEVQIVMGFFELLNDNKLDSVTPDMARLLGRTPTDIDVFWRENADSFRPRATSKSVLGDAQI